MLIPTPGKIVVALDLEDEMTTGGILIPDTARKAAQYGRVVAMGLPAQSPNGATIFFPVELQVGVTVAVGRWSGTELTYEGRSLTVLNHSDILAIATLEVSGVAA